MDKKLAGALGEYYAARYYRSRGYQIEAANYRTRQGEIDLVVSKDGVLVFSEVKLRAGGAGVTGREAVDRSKQRRLLQAAASYLQTVVKEEPPVRFDVVEVVHTGEEYTVNCIENAFQSEG